MLLKLCSSPDCPRQLLDQDSLQTCCKFLAQQARCSLLVFYDANLALELRPDADQSKCRATYGNETLVLTTALWQSCSYCQPCLLFESLDAVHLLCPGTVQCFFACRASENRGKLTNAGAMVYDLVGAVVEGLRRLSHNVALENPAFNNMIRILARILHLPALVTLHTPIIGTFYAVVTDAS